MFSTKSKINGKTEVAGVSIGTSMGTFKFYEPVPSPTAVSFYTIIKEHLFLFQFCSSAPSATLYHFSR